MWYVYRFWDSSTPKYIIIVCVISRHRNIGSIDMDSKKTKEPAAADSVRRVLGRIDDATFALNDDFEFTYVNSAAETVFDRSADELLGKRYPDVFGSARKNSYYKKYEEALDNQKKTTFVEYSKNIEEYVEVTVFPAEDGLTAQVHELSDYQSDVDGLHDMAKKSYQIASNIDDVIWMKEPESEEILYVNPAYEETWGRPPQTLYDDPHAFIDGIHPDDQADVRDAIPKQFEGEYDEEYRVVQPDGTVRWVNDKAVPLYDERGEIYRIVGIAEDITELKQREKQLADQRDELKELNRINDVIRDIDQRLVKSTTQSEIEQEVCDRLADSAPYCFATISDADVSSPWSPRVWNGITNEGIERLKKHVHEAGWIESEQKAIETGEIHVQNGIDGILDLNTLTGDSGRVELNVRAIASVPITFEETSFGVLSIYSNRITAFDEREQQVLTELGETIGHAIEAVERKKREEILTALNEASQQLLQTETKEEISAQVIETAVDVLDFPGIGIFLFDEKANVLEAVEYTPELVDYYDHNLRFEPGEKSITWNTFVSGETAVFDDVNTSELLAFPETNAQSALFVPLGEHGVFVAGSEDTGVFDEKTNNLVELLAATTEAAFDRFEREQDILERDQTLKEHNRKLTKVNQINEIIREVDQSLIQASSRKDIERTVCERLTQDDRFEFAWIGEKNPTQNALETRIWAGNGHSYLDDISLKLNENGEPSVRTAVSQSVVTIPNIAEHLHGGDWQSAALTRNYRSVISVPLTYEGVFYGALTVYASDQNAFDEMATSVLTELGDTIAYAINAIETKRGILANKVTELDLRIKNSDGIVNRIAKQTGSIVTGEDIVPQSDGTVQTFLRVSDAPVEDVLSLEDEWVAIDNIEHLDRENKSLYRVAISQPRVTPLLVNFGALPQEIRADGEELQIIVDFPIDADIRRFVDRLEEEFSEIELSSVRHHERQPQTKRGFRDELEEALTERQLEVLQTAFRGGFFESPRQINGQDIANILDVSQPTISYHMKEAQRKLLANVFEGEHLNEE